MFEAETNGSSSAKCRLHVRATADPSVAFELRAGGLVLALPDDCIESVAVDLSIHRREHVADDIGFHQLLPSAHGISAIGRDRLADDQA